MNLTSERKIQNEGFLCFLSLVRLLTLRAQRVSTAAFGSKNNCDFFIRKMNYLSSYLSITNTLPTTYFFRWRVKGVFSSLFLPKHRCNILLYAGAPTGAYHRLPFPLPDLIAATDTDARRNDTVCMQDLDHFGVLLFNIPLKLLMAHRQCIK